MMEIIHVQSYFYNTRKEFKDKELEIFAKNSENCRHKLLLNSIGGTLMAATNCSNNRCCDVCSPAVPLSVRLNVVQQTMLTAIDA